MVKTKQSVKLKVSEEEKQFGCSECHRRFTRKGDMYRHIRIHTGEKPFSCPECADEFSRKDDMVRHLRTHTGYKPYNCAYCYRKFSRRSDMYKHMVTHAGAKVKEECCPTCGCHISDHGLKHPRQMDNHKCVKQKQFLLHRCSLCEKGFGRKRDMTRHLRTHNLLDIVNLTANGSTTTTIVMNKENESHHENMQDVIHQPSQSSLQQSAQIESPVVPECKVVLLTNAGGTLDKPGLIHIVTTDEDFQNSLLGIKDDKPFHCPQCGDKFGRKSDMIRHLRIHSGLKPYNCNLCGRPFGRKEDMARHLLTHSGVKPYVCSICEKSFARKTDFEMHNTVHSMEVCPLQCHATFIDSVCEI